MGFLQKVFDVAATGLNKIDESRTSDDIADRKFLYAAKSVAGVPALLTCMAIETVAEKLHRPLDKSKLKF